MRQLFPLIIFCLFILISLTWEPSESAYAQDGGGYLVLNELNPWVTDGDLQVELLNPASSLVTLDGWSIEFLSGFRYEFPSGSGDVAGGGVHVLNITGSNPLDPDGDGCTLSSPSGPVDCIWWGQEFRGARLPISPGTPLWPQYEVYSDEIMFQTGDVIIRKPGSWPPDVSRIVDSNNWAYRNVDHATFGQTNPNPGPVLFLPMNGSVNISRFPLQVMGFDAGEVLFQVAPDEDFENIVMEETSVTHQVSTQGLPAGTYYWRVKDASRRSDPWSITAEVTYRGEAHANMVSWIENQCTRSSKPEGILLAQNKRGPVDTEPMFAPSDFTVISFHVVGGMHYLQNKDTDMVCLDGCPRDGDYNWEDPHPEILPLTGDHNDVYCSRASLAMMAAQGGCELSEDRISYYVFEEIGDRGRGARETGHLGTPDMPDPYMDLGHGRGVWPSDALLAIDWLYGVSFGTTWEHLGTRALFDDEDTSDTDTIKEYLDAGILIYRSIPGHAQVVDGYTEFREGGAEEVTISLRIREPGTLSTDPLCVGWTESWISDEIYYMFPPTSGPPIRCNEPGVLADTDFDGLCDFDETNRFLTDPDDTDSDDDGVQDMEDMMGYLFNIDGEYDPRDRDIDGDGVAKELDPDNDRENDDGTNDGCEDFDANGFFDDNGRESDCFDWEDDFTILNPGCFSGSIHIEGTVHLSQPGMSGYTTVTEDIQLEEGVPLDGATFGHEHTWDLTGEVTVTVGMPGIPDITGVGSGSGEGLASIQVEIDDEGHYIITTDTEPRTGTYTTSAGSRMSSHTLYLGFANHHFEYVSGDAPAFAWNMLEEMGKPNIFEGTIEVRDDGYVVASGDETWNMPSMSNLSGSMSRQWEIIISGPEGGG